MSEIKTDLMKANKITCYSKSEQGMMQTGQKWRGKFLSPFLKLLDSMKISANHLTLLSLISGLVFCALFLWSQFKLPAFMFLALHVLLDGMDGPLARYTGHASNRGSFTDTISDQVIVAATTVTMIHTGHCDALPGGLYLFFYTMVVVFTMIRNMLSIPYSWVVRPRFYIYTWFLVECYLFPGTLDYGLWFFSILLAWKMMTGFFHIRKKI